MRRLTAAQNPPRCGRRITLAPSNSRAAMLAHSSGEASSTTRTCVPAGAWFVTVARQRRSRSARLWQGMTMESRDSAEAVMPLRLSLGRPPNAAVSLLMLRARDVEGHRARGVKCPARGAIGDETGADERLEPDDTGKRQHGGGLPVLAGVSQERVSRQQTQPRRNLAAVQRMMMHDGERRLMTDVPAGGAGSATQIRVFVVEEKVAVEAAERFEALAACQ